MRLLLVLLTALAAVGCDSGGGEAPVPYSDKKVGQYIKFPDLIAKDAKGRRFHICEVAQGIVRRDLNAATGAKFPSCIYDQSQVQDVGNAHYAIASWVEIAGVRRAYSGDAEISEDEDGSPKFIRITRLEVEKGGR